MANLASNLGTNDPIQITIHMFRKLVDANFISVTTQFLFFINHYFVLVPYAGDILLGFSCTPWTNRSRFPIINDQPKKYSSKSDEIQIRKLWRDESTLI